MGSARSGRWLLLLGLLLAVGTWFAIVPRESEWLWQRKLVDFGHLPLFAFLAFAALHAPIVPTRTSIASIPLRHLTILALLMAFGAAIELFQGQVGRDPSLLDLLHDLAGVVLGFLYYERARIPRWQLAALTLLIVVPAGWPLITAGQAYRAREARFPVLFDATDPSSLDFVRVRQADLLRRNDAVRILFRPANYPAFILREPVRDWSGFDRLAIDLRLGDPRPDEVHIRVDDRHHDGRYSDRFNRRIPLESGTQYVEIPLSEIRAGPQSRELDLSQVRSVAIFLAKPSTPREIELLRIALERR